MMKIQVLGSGCKNCQQLESNVTQSIEELGVRAEIEHVYDFDQMIEMGMIMSPGLVVDGKLVSQGKVPNIEEIKRWLK